MTAETANPLARLEAAHRMLAEARTVDEVKELRDKAEVARLYARERDLGLEAQNYAAEIKIRAERKLGELLAEMPKNVGGNPNHLHDESGSPPPLRDLGISHIESHRWQQMAQIPEPVFEQHVAQEKAEERPLTTAGVRAERKLGELLAEMPKQGPREYQRSDQSTVAPTLRDCSSVRLIDPAAP